MAQAEYAEIAKHPKFRELSRKKVRFLVGWWLFSTIFYFGLPIWAGNTTLQSDVGNMKVIGNVPLLYLYALAQYALSIAIALYYTYWANKYADRLTEELLRDLRTKP